MSDVEKYFYNGGLNCAESTVRLFEDQTEYEIPHDLVRTMSGFGGGMQRGLTCGAVIASVALLGYFSGRREANEPRERSANLVREYLAAFEEHFGSLNCSDLTAGYEQKTDEMYAHCSQFVEESIRLVNEIISKYELP